MFGLGISARVGADPVGGAKAAEESGFDFVSMADHPCGTEPTYETWTVLTWIAAATSRIGIATRVLGVPYRPPAMVAKMAETLQRLSGGRFILGLGGGYSDEEFRAFGLGVPTPRQKVDGMVDAIHILRGLWSEASFDHAGPRYRVEAAAMEPKPETPIPIWLGTFGNRALEATGRLADGWIPSYGYTSLDQVVEMRKRVLAAAEAAGRDPASVRCVYNVPVWIDGPRNDTDVIAGPVGEVTERLLALTELGFTSLSLMPNGPDPRRQAETLAAETLPVLRTATA